MGSPSWWIRNIVIALGSAFFLAFGIESMVAEYGPRNAHEFIVYVSPQLLILLSLVGLLYPILQVYTLFRAGKDERHEEKS